ncbi:hypothetical protein M513_12777 [Trichuris suis]|uniref:GIY-YIG domain-containing protein n=1 Tax=Trichuris suis TaxID=68888 RepID=A0A085LN15_9BILA|nr:hypothetical protein M513_12777 [Trichuris suis]
MIEESSILTRLRNGKNVIDVTFEKHRDNRPVRGGKSDLFQVFHEHFRLNGREGAPHGRPTVLRETLLPKLDIQWLPGGTDFFCHYTRDCPAAEHVPSLTVPLLILPYYNGLGEKIKRTGRTIGFQVYFKSAASVRSIVRNDRVRLAPNEKAGVIYEILCTFSASYIGETGNRLSHRYEQHLNRLNPYNSALNDQKGLGMRRCGLPRKLQPNEAMDEAIKASAIVEHASRCDGQLHPNVIANEPDFHLRKIKEALYIRHNVVINRDKGTEVSDTWTNLIMRNRLCTTTTAD